jgi:hypothetical protein
VKAPKFASSIRRWRNTNTCNIRGVENYSGYNIEIIGVYIREHVFLYNEA